MMKTGILIIITSVCLLVSIPHAFATEPQIIQIFQPGGPIGFSLHDSDDNMICD